MKTGKRITIILTSWIFLILTGIGGIVCVTKKSVIDKDTIDWNNISPIVRSVKVAPITEDTLFIKRLERSTKELLK